MAKRHREKNRQRKHQKKAAILSPPLPEPPALPQKTKYVPPQPQQSYSDPVVDDSDEMSESENNSLVAFSAPSETSLDHDMITDDPTDHHANKRKRADTNPDEAAPASNRSFSSSLPRPSPHNQLGITFGDLSPISSPTTNLESSLPTMTVTSQQNEAATSTPRTSTPNQLTNPPNQGDIPSRPPSYEVKDLKITGFIGDNPLIGIETRHIVSWKKIPGPKAIVYPHDASFNETTKVRTGKQLELAITSYLKRTGHVVTAPKPTDGVEERKPFNRRPWVFLISQLAEKDLDKILAQGFITNEHASLHVIPFSPDPSHYIGRIKNLTIEPNLHQTVVKLIQKTISEDSVTMDFIVNFVTTYHDTIPPLVLKSSSTINWIINSVRAYHIQSEGRLGIEHSQWKWYIYTPTRIQERAELWLKTLAAISFDATIYGVGDTITNTKCTRCKSTNHTDLECQGYAC